MNNINDYFLFGSVVVLTLLLGLKNMDKVFYAVFTFVLLFEILNIDYEVTMNKIQELAENGEVFFG